MKLTDLSEAKSKPAFPQWKTDEENIIVSCVGYNIRTLKGVPFDKDVFEEFNNFQLIGVDISDNGLTDVEGFPKFDSYGDIDASHNRLTSCKGFPRNVQTLWLHNNNIRSVKDDILPFFDHMFDITLTNNPVEKGPLLSLFKLNGLQAVVTSEKELYKIMNKYLKIKNRGVKEMLECQDELIEAGYEEQAKL